MIQLRKIIYWHFAIYKGEDPTIDPVNLPDGSVSSLDASSSLL